MSATQSKPNGKQAYKPKPQHSEASLSDFVFGKVQPQAIPLEEAVLGALMLDREAVPVICEVLRPESFYLPAHQEIFSAIVALHHGSYPVDLLTVQEHLKKSGKLDKIGGGYYLVELSNRVASAANIEYHARIIAQKHIQRQLGAFGTTVCRDAYEDTVDVFTMLDEAETALFNIRGHKTTNQKHVSGITKKVFDNMMRATDQVGVTGIVSGIDDLDSITGGWQDSDLIILAARPGMGKTALALTVALNAAENGKPVQIFSLEMPESQLVARLVSIISGVPLGKITKGGVFELAEDGVKYRRVPVQDWEWQAVGIAIEKLNALPIYIDDTPAINIFELRARARRAQQKHGVRLVVVDYLQLVTVGDDDRRGGNREQEVGAISRTLKAVAKSMNVPVIALSQLSRAVEMRGGSKRPQLSDLRESGSVEQDSDIVLFIYRAEYYEITEDETGKSLKGVAEIIIAKHRNGALDTVRCRFEDTLTRFSNLDKFDRDQNFPASAPQYTPALDPNVVTQSRKMNEETIPF